MNSQTNSNTNIINNNNGNENVVHQNNIDNNANHLNQNNQITQNIPISQTNVNNELGHNNQINLINEIIQEEPNQNIQNNLNNQEGRNSKGGSSSGSASYYKLYSGLFPKKHSIDLEYIDDTNIYYYNYYKPEKTLNTEIKMKCKLI